MNQLLFVYGTLRRAATHHQHANLLQHASFVAPASYQAKLYLVGDYPGAVPSSHAADQVVGEVFRLHNAVATLAAADQYEGCGRGFAAPTEYLRVIQPVTLATGETVSAWVYVYNHSTAGLARILSGDFLQR
jgi:gamma-glutamylcyclotransferase (GGCT)/AIG2-like uncharacterized protein YtfP